MVLGSGSARKGRFTSNSTTSISSYIAMQLECHRHTTEEFKLQRPIP